MFSSIEHFYQSRFILCSDGTSKLQYLVIGYTILSSFHYFGFINLTGMSHSDFHDMKVFVKF